MIRAAARFRNGNGLELERQNSGNNLTVFEKKWADLFMFNQRGKATAKNIN